MPHLRRTPRLLCKRKRSDLQRFVGFLEYTSIAAIDSLFLLGVQGQLSRIPMYDISYSPSVF